MARFVDLKISKIRRLVGKEGQILGAVSGGVDSTVAAKLMHRAIRDRFHAVLVNNDVTRLTKCEQVQKTLKWYLGISLTIVDASQQILDGLKWIEDPEQKRKLIGESRILGEVTPEREELVRRADAIPINMMREAGLFD